MIIVFYFSRPESKQVSSSAPGHHEHMRRSHPEMEREKDREKNDYRNRPKVRGQHYSLERLAEAEVSSRPRPRSFYDNQTSGRDSRDQRHPVESKDV